MNLHHTRNLCLALLLGGTFLEVLNAQTITTFQVPQAAPATSGSLSVSSINKSGIIAGYLLDTSGNLKGWRRSVNGTITLLVDPLDTGTPTATAVYGIANNGTMVGYYYDTAAGIYNGYFHTGSGIWQTYSVPDQPAGTDTIVGGINSQPDQFCGALLPPPYSTYSAFLSIGGTVTIFGMEGSSDTQCDGLNDSGDTVGFYTDSAGVDHGWLRTSDGTITTIDVPTASTSAGTAPCAGTVGGTAVNGINDKGFISGHYWDKHFNEHGFIRTPAGKFITVNVPGAFQTGGGGLNSAGIMVGHYSDSSCNNSGYIYTPPTE